MKTYKNKQGVIAKEVNTPSGKYYEIKSNEFNGHIPAMMIENSCDWEEIKEKPDNRDYVVLEYSNDNDVYTRVDSPQGILFVKEGEGCVYTEEELVSNYKNLTMHSIQRKSDNAIYKVGENVSPMYSKTLYGPVRRFVAVGNTVQIWGNFLGIEGMGFLHQINPYTIKGYEVLEMVNPETYETYTFRNGDCVGISNLEGGKQALVLATASTDFSKLLITKIKRLSDGQVIAVGDEFEYMSKREGSFTSTLKVIEFEVAPADEGTGKLTFIHEHPIWGKWLRLGGFTIIPKFVTTDGVTINTNDEYWVVFKVMSGFQINAKRYNGKKRKTYLITFSSRALAEKYVLDNTKGLSITDIIEIGGSISSDFYNQLVKRLRPSEELDETFDDLPF